MTTEVRGCYLCGINIHKPNTFKIMRTSQTNTHDYENGVTESLQPSKIKKTVVAAAGIAAAAGIGVAATVVAQNIGTDEPVPENSEISENSDAVAHAAAHSASRPAAHETRHEAVEHSTPAHAADANAPTADATDDVAVLEPIVDADIDDGEIAEASITEATMFDDEDLAYEYGLVQTDIEAAPAEFNIEDEIPVLENTVSIEYFPVADVIIDVDMADNADAWPSPDTSSEEQDAWPAPTSDIDAWANIEEWSGEIEDVNRDTGAWPGETGAWPFAHESNGEIAGI